MYTLVLADPKIQRIIKEDLKKLNKKNKIKFISTQNKSENILPYLNSKWFGSKIFLEQSPPEGPPLDTFEKKHLNKMIHLTVTDFYELLFQKIPIHLIKKYNFDLKLNVSNNSFLDSPLKRLCDVAYASLLLILTMPLFIVVPLLIKADSPGPIFFRQKRTGKSNKPFWIIKFRTMKVDAERNGPQWAQLNDNRITRLGRFLRKTRIDELPQLFNVIRGEMSLIGPRPERPEFDETLRAAIPLYDKRYSLKPGITGWAQVNFPYGSSIDDAMEKVELDLFYLKNATLWLDLKILFKTAFIVITAGGR